MKPGHKIQLVAMLSWKLPPAHPANREQIPTTMEIQTCCVEKKNSPFVYERVVFVSDEWPWWWDVYCNHSRRFQYTLRTLSGLGCYPNRKDQPSWEAPTAEAGGISLACCPHQWQTQRETFPQGRHGRLLDHVLVSLVSDVFWCSISVSIMVSLVGKELVQIAWHLKVWCQDSYIYIISI